MNVLPSKTLPEYVVRIGDQVHLVRNVHLVVLPDGTEGISQAEIHRVHLEVVLAILGRYPDERHGPIASATMEFLVDALWASDPVAAAKRMQLTVEDLLDDDGFRELPETMAHRARRGLHSRMTDPWLAGRKR